MKGELFSDDQVERLVRRHLQGTISAPTPSSWVMPRRVGGLRARLSATTGLAVTLVITVLGAATLVALFSARQPPTVGSAATSSPKTTDPLAASASQTAQPNSTQTAELTPAATATQPSGSTPVPIAFERAMDLALADPLLGDYLSRHQHLDPVAVESYIRIVSGNVSAILVMLEFRGFADDYPLGACDIYREVDRVVGVAWLVDERGERILARSPIWPGGVRCL